MAEIIGLLLIYIFPVVLTIVAMYFRSNIHTEVGKQGYVTEKSVESAETWIYAQIIAPKVILKVAIICILQISLMAIFMLIIKSNYKMIMMVCSFVGFIYVFVPFFLVDKKLENFQENELFD